MGGVTHTDIAAYVLGVLDEEENAVFEAHLLECPHCQLDLLEFYDLPEILADIRQYWPEPPMAAPTELSRLLDEVAVARRRRRTIVLLAAAAAVLLIVAGPLVTLGLLGSTNQIDGSASPQAAVSAPGQAGSENTQSISSTGPNGSVQAQVVVHGTAWGSEMSVEISGLTPPVTCQLYVISWTGEASLVTSWTIPAQSDLPGSVLQTHRISGGSSLQPADIQKFEIRGGDGAVLATIPHW